MACRHKHSPFGRFTLILSAGLYLAAFFHAAVNAAPALQPLRFQPSEDDPVSRDIAAFLQSHAPDLVQSGYHSALVDLNEDGIMEAIVRNVACEKNTGAECRFLILGGNKNDILILGDIPAHDLQLGTSYSQGVRDLMVLKNGLNDFDYDVYTWKSEQGRYEPAD